MVNPIPESIKNIWDEWNIRGLILFSLSLQIVLILLAPFRKASGNKLFIMLIWLTYLLADWVANFGVGLIADRARDTPYPSENNELLAFWAPFMLVHLGGPDTITAFSLEDNELWLRHLLALIFQAVGAVYVFLLTLPGNKLLIPTILVFIAGMIKYSERIRALYLGSLKKLQDSIFRKWTDDFSETVDDITPTDSDLDYIKMAYQYFELYEPFYIDFPGREVVIDKNPCFLSAKVGQDPEKAMRIIEVVSNLVYQFFHTKIQITHSVLGIILRFMCFGSVVAALSAFYFQVEKHGFNKFDVRVTYTLLLGAIALDIIAFFMLIFSDWMFIALWENSDKSALGKIKNSIAAIIRRFLNLKSARWQTCHLHSRHEVFATPLLFRRWSGSVSGLSWMRYCLEERSRRVQKVIARLGLADIVDGIRVEASLSHEPLTKELWVFLFSEIKRKSAGTGDWRRKCSASGESTLQEFHETGVISTLMKTGQVKDAYANFTVNLELWHLATELLYGKTAEESFDDNTSNKREVSKILSDYMMYLSLSKATMINFPNFISRRILNGFDEGVNELSLKRVPMKDACETIISNQPPGLEDELNLVRKLEEIGDKDKMWDLISKVWVELLLYASMNCSGRAHVRQLSKGGDLLTFVWLLWHGFIKEY